MLETQSNAAKERRYKHTRGVPKKEETKTDGAVEPGPG